MRLGDVGKQTRRVRVVRVTDSMWRTQALRMGIAEGAAIEIRRVYTRGPILVVAGSALVAVGRPLAEQIEVAVLK